MTAAYSSWESDKCGINPGFQVLLANLEISRKASDECDAFVTLSIWPFQVSVLFMTSKWS